MSGAALWANRKREGEGSAGDKGGASQLSWGPSILAPELGRTKLKAETLWRLLSFIPSFCYGAAGGVSIVSGVALWRCEKSLAKFGISITNCLQHSWKVYLQYFAEMVRIQGGGGGEFGGRQGSKDMRDRDTAEGRDRGKPRTVANMRERDRTLRWLFLGLFFTHSDSFSHKLELDPVPRFNFWIFEYICIPPETSRVHQELWELMHHM